MATATAPRTRTRAPTRCSICRQTGHTKRKCPQAVATATVAAPVTNPIDATDCPICMDPLAKTNCCTTSCGHQFCLKCFVTHTKTKSNCPVCRADIPGAGTQRPATQVQPRFQYPVAEYMDALNQARANIQQAWRATPPNDFSIFIQNQ